jgi:hypothetical protein
MATKKIAAIPTKLGVTQGYRERAFPREAARAGCRAEHEFADPEESSATIPATPYRNE